MGPLILLLHLDQKEEKHPFHHLLEAVDSTILHQRQAIIIKKSLLAPIQRDQLYAVVGKEVKNQILQALDLTVQTQRVQHQDRQDILSAAKPKHLNTSHLLHIEI